MNQHILLSTFPALHMVVAVSKTRPISAIEAKISEGFSHFGENKAQELLEKSKANLSVTWHFIGQIQTNKLKDIVSVASWIHSVDQLKQVVLIEKYASYYQKDINILIQLNLTHETQKGGISSNELEPFIQLISSYSHVKLRGLMVMGPSDADLIKTEAVFRQAHDIFIGLKKKYPEMTELSMGMSHDYELAYKYGSTCFRLGTMLFT